MRKTLREIADLVNGVVEGDENAVVTGVAGIKDARPGDITFVGNPKYLPLLPTTRASAVIVAYDAPACERDLIRTEQPYLAFTQVLKLCTVPPPVPKGIHPSSVIGRDVFLGEDVALHAGVVLEDGCKVGAKTVLYPAVCVGTQVEIGAECIIYPRVVIASNVLIGDRVIIHSGAVVGSRPCPEDTRRHRTGELLTEGSVVIEDDVEIGANVTIDCSRTGTTIIGRGTKIDNLVHIGGDAAVGCNCIIVSHVSVGSGCKVGNGVTIAGQAGVFDSASVGEGAIVAARAGVTKDVEPSHVVSGFPAFSHEKWLRITASMKRLPTMVRDIHDFKKRLDKLERMENGKAEND
ncbi:MAG: UDP-3-O-(3-hydroxymyristoyl)glucosamine N-acyltransferase [Candidatus Lindowbacteria bacterium]|nr:UDP-3-O-(3-hydroxymyristoyl)glucosamine N-acyltransferase [Candidatus Lindowbacteria bacterium]